MLVCPDLQMAAIGNRSDSTELNSTMRNTLFYGDNLNVLREHVVDESVDLIYLDPPFNSARNYNLLFKQVKGESSAAQIQPG